MNVQIATLLVATLATTGGKTVTETKVKSGYAESNGAKVYYQVHGDGAGVPLVLLHGAFMTIDTNWATILPALTSSRKVIALELRGHGHSTDSEQPFSAQTMSDDVAAVLRHLGVKQADVLGYSMGGTVAAGVAIRHPGLVRKLVVVSAAFDNSGWEPEAFERFKALPADFAPKPFVDAYEKVAPDPKRWPVLVKKVKQMGTQFPGWSDSELRALKAPLLIVMGDRDGYRTERAVAVSRLVPSGQLGVVPGGDHFFLWARTDLLLSMVTSFLDARS